MSHIYPFSCSHSHEVVLHGFVKTSSLHNRLSTIFSRDRDQCEKKLFDLSSSLVINSLCCCHFKLYFIIVNDIHHSFVFPVIHDKKKDKWMMSATIKNEVKLETTLTSWIEKRLSMKGWRIFFLAPVVWKYGGQTTMWNKTSGNKERWRWETESVKLNKRCVLREWREQSNFRIWVW
jgi:hypothetical protein